MQCSDNFFLHLCSLGFILIGLVNRTIFNYYHRLSGITHSSKESTEQRDRIVNVRV